MKVKSILLLTTIAVSALVVACDTPSQKVWVEVSCDEFNNNHHIEQMLPLQVQPGEPFEVKLCSNPSTGFQWSEEAQISDSAVLKQEDHEFIGPESDPPPPPGTPGQEVWAFKALKEGSSAVFLEYSQPWEGGEKGVWTCTVNVVVKESPVIPSEDAGKIMKEKLFLEDTTWKLESYGVKDNQQVVIENTEITVEFKSEENEFSGSAGCNGYFGSYETDKSKLTIIPPIGSTVMACPEPIMNQEKEYLDLLKTTENFEIQNSKLAITCSDNRMMFFVTQSRPATPEGPEDVRDEVLGYLRDNVREDVPVANAAWERRDATPKGLVGQTTIEFITSDYWEVTVSYPLVAPQNTVYNVLVTNHKSGWHWQGEVRPDDGVTETGQEKPEGTLTATELLSEPPYDTEVKIYGRVDGLGELMCSCFFLISGRESVQVWYGTMLENDDTVRPAVSVEGIRNGDKVIVTGELKGEGGVHYSKDDFWAKSITVP